MNIPTRIVPEAPSEPVICVDGAFGVMGLNLSHWPGNTTPEELRHDLSTGCALAFAELPEAQRMSLAKGAVAIVNNHYDTDGLCAAFATRYPDRALPHAEALLDAARCGDFFQLPNLDALKLDAIVAGFADVERSPIKDDLQGLSDYERWNRAQDELVDRLPSILADLDGGLDAYTDLWRETVDNVLADLEDLEETEREDVPALDLTLWTAEEGRGSSRPSSLGLFDPGRHALFSKTKADRVLAIGPIDGGVSYRLIISTLSWFDLVTEKRFPRPDLTELALTLNRLEGTAPSDTLAWHAQRIENASPELWFGEADQEAFAEHNKVLAPSELEPDQVLPEIEKALTPPAGG